MRLLLDTHVIIALCRAEIDRRFPEILAKLADSATEAFASAASLWEISIKTRLGKLQAGIELTNLPMLLESYGVDLLDINRHHAVNYAQPDPATNDPFDRMLLVQCRLESMKLATVDRALVDHPLAWRPGEP